MSSTNRATVFQFRVVHDVSCVRSCVRSCALKFASGVGCVQDPCPAAPLARRCPAGVPFIFFVGGQGSRKTGAEEFRKIAVRDGNKALVPMQIPNVGGTPLEENPYFQLEKSLPYTTLKKTLLPPLEKPFFVPHSKPTS